MAGWKTLSSDIVYETPWFEIHRDAVLDHNGKELTYSFLKLPNPAVTIIAVNDDGAVLLQKNYRYTIDQTIWEVPAGHSDGQEPLVAAKRELFEEAGLTSATWSSLGEARLGAGVADVHHYIFLAQNVQQATDERDRDEDITGQRFVSIPEIRTMILHNEIIDGASLIGLYRFMLESKEGDI